MNKHQSANFMILMSYRIIMHYIVPTLYCILVLLLFVYVNINLCGNYFCLSNVIRFMGQNIKSLVACVCVCTRVLGAEYLEND